MYDKLDVPAVDLKVGDLVMDVSLKITYVSLYLPDDPRGTTLVKYDDGRDSREYRNTDRFTVLREAS